MTSEQKAQEGLKLLKAAILELLRTHPEGLRNIDIATKLDIRTDREGKQKDYLSWSVLSLLMKEGAVTCRKENRSNWYSLNE